MVRVSKDVLEQVFDSAGKNLVGKIMKRFEILNNVDDIKKEVKELVYESMRDTKFVLTCISSGMKCKKIEFSKDNEEL